MRRSGSAGGGGQGSPPRIAEDAARSFRAALDDFPRLELLGLDRTHHHAVGRMLVRYRRHKLTYVDASSLVFLAERRITEVWGTDYDLALGAARVLP